MGSGGAAPEQAQRAEHRRPGGRYRDALAMSLPRPDSVAVSVDFAGQGDQRRLRVRCLGRSWSTCRRPTILRLDRGLVPGPGPGEVAPGRRRHRYGGDPAPAHPVAGVTAIELVGNPYRASSGRAADRGGGRPSGAGPAGSCCVRGIWAPFEIVVYVDVFEHIADDVAEAARGPDRLGAPGGRVRPRARRGSAIYGMLDRKSGHHRCDRKGRAGTVDITAGWFLPGRRRPTLRRGRSRCPMGRRTR